MVKKIYLNYPLNRVPVNGLVRLDDSYYRRGYANRSTREIQLVLVSASGIIFNVIDFVPSNTLVSYYKENGTH